MTIDFTVKPTLAGELVVLRPVASTDVLTLHELMADQEMSMLTGVQSREPSVPEAAGQTRWPQDRGNSPFRAEQSLLITAADTGTDIPGTDPIGLA